MIGALVPPVRLQLHMGIGAGEATLLYIGGVHNSWEYVIGGDPLRQIGVAEPLAKNGQTVISPEAFEHLEGYVECTPVEAERVADSGHRGFVVQGEFESGWESMIGRPKGWPETEEESAGEKGQREGGEGEGGGGRAGWLSKLWRSRYRLYGQLR